MRLPPKALPTSRRSRSIVAIVIVSQCPHAPVVGVSKRRRGYGLCAYASRRAPAASMPRMKCTGERPPVEPRGAVTPPPTFAPLVALWIAAYAGLRSDCVYVRAEVGRSQRRWFGSFQISQCFTNGYRLAAFAAKPANVVLERGTQFGEWPPFAQRGVPQSVTTGTSPRSCRPRRIASERFQEGAPRRDSISFQCRV